MTQVDTGGLLADQIESAIHITIRRRNEVGRVVSENLMPEHRSKIVAALRVPPPDSGGVREALHPDTRDLVEKLSWALEAKLRRAEIKYGYTNGWLTDNWEAECREHLLRHLEKGDPLDVVAYAAFMWAREWSTASADSRLEFLPIFELWADAMLIGQPDREILRDDVRKAAALSRPSHCTERREEIDFSDPLTDAIMGAARLHTHDHTTALKITADVLIAIEDYRALTEQNSGPTAGREEIARILHDNFYTGEPGESEAIKAATDAILILRAGRNEVARYICGHFLCALDDCSCEPGLAAFNHADAIAALSLRPTSGTGPLLQEHTSPDWQQDQAETSVLPRTPSPSAEPVACQPTDRDILMDLKAAFDGRNVARKNIALRRAYDALDRSDLRLPPVSDARQKAIAAISHVVSSRDDLGNEHFVLLSDAVTAALSPSYKTGGGK